MKKSVFGILFFVFSVAPLFAHHSAAALGIESNEITKEKARVLGCKNLYGSQVRRIYPNSGAAAAGLQPFDYVYQINEYETSDDLGLSHITTKFSPGDEVTVFYIRNGESLQTSLNLSDRNHLEMAHRPASQDPFLGVERMHKRNPAGIYGIPVEIVHNSTAEALGLQDGDFITRIDNNRLFDWHDLAAAIDNREVGEPIALEVYRNGETLNLERPIKSRAATHNDHSRPNGPVIIEGEPAEETIATAKLIEATPDEIEEFREEVEAEIEEEMPVISNLQYARIKVFPNPNTGIFDLEFELEGEGQTIVRIFSSAGQQVYLNNLGNFSGVFSDRIDIANEVRGFYFLQVMQGDQAVTKKLILQ